MNLLPCATCRRHVRHGESACPFCSAPLPQRTNAAFTPARQLRLSRATLFALGALFAPLSCDEGGPQPKDAGPEDAGPRVDTADLAIPPYGAAAPPFDPVDPTAPVDAGTAVDPGNAVPAYGAPPPPDGDAGAAP